MLNTSLHNPNVKDKVWSHDYHMITTITKYYDVHEDVIMFNTKEDNYHMI